MVSSPTSEYYAKKKTSDNPEGIQQHPTTSNNYLSAVIAKIQKIPKYYKINWPNDIEWGWMMLNDIKC